MDLFKADLAELEGFLSRLTPEQNAELHGALGGAFDGIRKLSAVPIPSKIIKAIIFAAGQAMMGGGTFAKALAPEKMANQADLADSPRCAVLFRRLGSL